MNHSRIQSELQKSGFDLCHPIHTSWYNTLINDEGLVESGTLQPLPEPSSSTGSATVFKTDDDGDDGCCAHHNCNSLLIGNTKIIWPIFLKWLAIKVQQKKDEINQGSSSKVYDQTLSDEEALEQIDSPFDTFVQESLTSVLERYCQEYSEELISYEVFWSNGNRQKVSFDQPPPQPPLSQQQQQHDSTTMTKGTKGSSDNHCYNNNNNTETNNSFLVSMQRVATTTGLYWHDNDATKLCVHPKYGTWTAFRTVVVFQMKEKDGDDANYCSNTTNKNPPPCPPPPCPCPVTKNEIQMAKRVFDHALSTSSSSNTNGYGTTLDKSWNELCQYLHGTVCTGSAWDAVPESMKPWIQLRDCFSVGRKEEEEDSNNWNWKYSQEQLLYHYTKDPEILRMELERIKNDADLNRSKV